LEHTITPCAGKCTNGSIKWYILNQLDLLG
jgi:hypothetical protein